MESGGNSVAGSQSPVQPFFRSHFVTKQSEESWLGLGLQDDTWFCCGWDSVATVCPTCSTLGAEAFVAF